MEKYLGKVLIIDGSYMCHRALHTPAMQELKTSTGIPSGGVFGFFRMFQSEIKKWSGYYPIVCWDKGLSKRRTDLYEDYKANRQRKEADALIAAGLMPPDDEGRKYIEEYHRQRNDIIQILKAMGVPSLLIPGWEGDDLMYLISKVTDDAVLISDDKDMIQLVSPTLKIRRAMRDELITWEDSDPSYRHPHYTIAKAICGDASDNIPQVAKGVGGTSAEKLASAMESGTNLDEFKELLIKFAEESTGAIVKKANAVLENWNQFSINYQLTDLRLVEPPAGFEDILKNLITGVIGHSNILLSYSMIGRYEMTTIFPDQINAILAVSAGQVLKEV